MNKQSMLWGVVLVVTLVFSNIPEIAAAPKQQKKVEQKDPPKMGGTLVVGLGKEIGNPNPFIGTSSTTSLSGRPRTSPC